MRKWIGRVLVGILALVLAAVASLLIVASLAKLPGDNLTPAGIRQSTSKYVKMRDGVEIAVTVDLPPDLKVGERVPVLMRTTRYWREPEISWVLRTLIALHRAPADEEVEDEQGTYFNARHFAVLAVDARGSGASGGSRAIEFSPGEVADIGEVAAWAAKQPWSNGRVGAFGISYDGNTAELAAVPNQPAIRAVMPLYDDFDVFSEIQEGGVANRLLLGWGDAVAAMDRDDVCDADQVKGWNCCKDRLMIAGVRPVDADPRGKHLRELVSQRHNLNVAEAIAKVEFRDDRAGAFRLEDISPYGLRAQIEASKVPMMVWCGWLDGEGCEEALNRYRNVSNPQELIIGPLSHGGDFNVDPFASNHTPAVPPVEQQLKMEADFFDRALREASPQPVESSIQYYTMGEGQWHTTKAWPPAGLSVERLYFAEHNILTETVPPETSASDSYRVDFATSSGNQTIWYWLKSALFRQYRPSGTPGSAEAMWCIQTVRTKIRSC